MSLPRNYIYYYLIFIRRRRAENMPRAANSLADAVRGVKKAEEIKSIGVPSATHIIIITTTTDAYIEISIAPTAVSDWLANGSKRIIIKIKKIRIGIKFCQRFNEKIQTEIYSTNYTAHIIL